MLLVVVDDWLLLLEKGWEIGLIASPCSHRSSESDSLALSAGIAN